MDLEKTYDRVCREELWRVLDEYGVKEYLVMGMKSPYERSGMCAKWKKGVGQYFEVRGLRHGYVRYPGSSVSSLIEGLTR